MNFGQPYLSWLALFLFLVGTLCLLPQASNWAGMSLAEVLGRMDVFYKRHKKSTIRPGFPPYLIGDRFHRHGGIKSTGRGVFFFALNMALAYFLVFIFSIEEVELPAALSVVIVVEFFLLSHLYGRRQRFYAKNHAECMTLHTAHNRMVGRLIDHNTSKHGMELPKDGRVITLVFQVEKSYFPMTDYGHFELDMWLPLTMYKAFAWGIVSDKSVFGRDVTVFLSPCSKNPHAPLGVHHRIVGVSQQVYAQLLPIDLAEVRSHLRRIDPQVADMTHDEYALNRAKREANC